MSKLDIEQKVFVIGMFKTGTKSMGKALRILGYQVTDRPWFILNDNWCNDISKWEQYFPVIKERASQYNGFSDAPWMFLYNYLDMWYPDAKFILTVRKDFETYYLSEMYQWRNKKSPPTKEKFKKRYVDHNNQVKKYFEFMSQYRKENNFIELCLENGDSFQNWLTICSFLNRDIPKEPFPHINKSRRKK